MRKRAPDRWLSYCFYANFMPNDFECTINLLHTTLAINMEPVLDALSLFAL